MLHQLSGCSARTLVTHTSRLLDVEPPLSAGGGPEIVTRHNRFPRDGEPHEFKLRPLSGLWV